MDYKYFDNPQVYVCVKNENLKNYFLLNGANGTFIIVFIKKFICFLIFHNFVPFKS